jgi:tetratricopeptide (TPR) repeat protein
MCPRRLGVRSRLLSCLTLSLGLLLGACATGPAPDVPPALLDDAQFGQASEPIDPADVFRLSAAMREYLDTEIIPAARTSGGIRQALTEELYNRGKLKLEYESSMTRNAAQAFDARSGNCLSLVIMTAAFAKELGLKVTYQSIGTDDMWSRAGDFYFLSGHVNLQLEKHVSEMDARYDRNGTYTIDFLPSENSVGWNATIISEDRVLAMYMNNRAAEALVRGQVDDAYWRAREAIRLDPGFLSALNTLGVVYLRHGDPRRAEAVLGFVTQRDKDNPRVLANYAQALRDLGRTDEAEAIQQRLAKIEPYPPFYFFNRGQAALHAGNLVDAREYFKRELDRSPDYHEFHYWLAIADFGLGRVDEARKELALAMQDAVKRSDHDLYAAKLDKLKAYMQQPAVR